MLRQIASVGSLTLLSRITGFVRDMVLASLLGAGLAADAFVVAQRLPNHFRAIFGEGAFNAAFVPGYARLLEQQGLPAARHFAASLLRILLLSLLLVTALAMGFMPQMVSLLAPGFSAYPEKFALAVNLTRITFPYLLFISLVTLFSGILNAHERFASPAFAPVLLNLSMIAALLASAFFPDAAHAAAWGVFIAGVLELALVVIDAKRAGLMPALLTAPSDDTQQKSMTAFWKALGPGVIGSAGVQLAMFADTIIASLLPTGAVASLYYADRLYQLPVGMIGIAAGTVLLPTMTKFWAAGDDHAAHKAQNQAMALTLLFSTPFLIAFLMVPDTIMRGLFMRGAFDSDAARASGLVLAAYTTGLPAIVLIRSAVASFHARGDTRTPVIAAFIGLGVNIGLKIMLADPWGASGLALATAIGAWINFGLLVAFAMARDWMSPDAALGRWLLVIAVCALVMAVIVHVAGPPIHHFSHGLPIAQNETELAILALSGLFAYIAPLFVLIRVFDLSLKHE
jgi:putative peptidoglycan lipid II flippase